MAAGLILPFAVDGSALAQERVGIAGAVNPQSERDRAGQVRTIVIGDDLSFRDRIITGEIGLVQVMFVDGSTFTVGPSARVVIDEFVYNPSTGTGSLVAEVTSGALRFVGGKLSKGNNEVRFRTGGGTLGVRGGIVNLDESPPCLEDGRCPTATASLVFGAELNLSLPDGGRRRIHQPGYSFVFFEGGRVEITPTSELNQSALQQSLTGRPGASGGSPNIPTSDQVVASSLPTINSVLRPTTVLPRPKPIINTSRLSPDDNVPGISETENVIADTITEPADSDFVRETVAEEIDPFPPGPPFVVADDIGAASTPSLFRPENGALVTDPGKVGIVTEFDLSQAGAQLVENGDGEVVALRIGRDTLPFPAREGETEIAPFQSESLDIRARGTVLRGPDNFALYYLQEDVPGGAGADTVLYVLTGRPTVRDVVLPDGTRAARIRSYELSNDFQKESQGIRSELRHLNPLVAREFGDALAKAVETPFYIVDRVAKSDVANTLYAGLLIDGQGGNQKSAINVDTGFVEGAGKRLQIAGHRRGTYRLSANDAAAVMSGPTGTLSATSNGPEASLYGRRGDNFVYTSGTETRPRNEQESSVFLDRRHRGGLLTVNELHSSTTQVASLDSTTGVGGLSRSTRTLRGFAAGMMEPNSVTSRPFRSTGVGQFLVRFDAQQSNLGGVIEVEDVFNEDPFVRSFNLAFGTDLFGSSSTSRSTYIDDDRFAAVATGPSARPGSPQTTMTTDSGQVIRHTRSNPDTYMVSSDTVPQPELFSSAGVRECECRFMEWGWWGTGTAFKANGAPNRRDFAHLGTWVAGDITPEEDLPTVGKASYEGHVVGNVVAEQSDGTTARYVAVGELDVEYDFGERTGELEISRFDGRSFSGSIAGGVGPDGRFNQFSGQLRGSGLRGSTDGAFARGPLGAAQGVLGSFGVRGNGYKAVGSYVGERQ
ncbi:MAG: hypothetical protein AAGB11_19000 [Pseudomonadota bacterium]